MLAMGLSPRVRGNHVIPHHFPADDGSIPARAGEPSRTRLDAWLTRVYPRACGGTTSTSACMSPAGGLSPRVRGNRRRRLQHAVRERSIPARAGEPAATDKS